MENKIIEDEIYYNIPQDYEEYDKYVEVLKKVIQNNDVKNIGVVAPYGSGKSSLIKRFISNSNKNEEKISQNIITVSLANYTSIIESNTHRNKSLDPKIQEEIEVEKSILQQLFYKNDNKNTPYSRFSSLNKIKGNNICISVLSTIIIACVGFFFLYFTCDSFRYLRYSKYKNFILFLIAIIALVNVFFLIFKILNSKKINNIEIGNMKFGKNDKNEISVFNQYLDEIIYFFQKNNYKILIIEDLDRFENIKIFSKLKELNILLNNNDYIIKKHKKITFIYALKDSLFKDEETRSKFFEYIIPVIPSISKENIKGILNNMLNKNTNQQLLSDNLIIDICDYISNRRVLNNIVNDFYLYKKVLENDYTNVDENNKLFSLMTLKNIYPIEFELLQEQDEQSEIYKILNIEKSKYQEKLVENYNDEIHELENLIMKADNELTDTFNDLKNILIGCICKEGYPFISFNNDFKSFKNLEEITISYREYYSVAEKKFKIKDLEKQYYEIGYFASKEENMTHKNNNKRDEILERIKKLVKEKEEILNYSFSKLYIKNKELMNNIGFSNELIKLLLVNGYIDENYMGYLSINDNSFISENDSKLRRKINKYESIGFLSKIENPSKLILTLHKDRFKSKDIINVYLLDELFKDDTSYKEKQDNMIEFFENNPEDIKIFIKEIYLKYLNFKDLIIKLAVKCSLLWNLIYSNLEIDKAIKNEIFIKIIHHKKVDINYLIKMNEDSCIEQYINNFEDFGNVFKINNYTIKDLNENFNLKFKSFRYFENNYTNEFILQNNCYEISFENIKSILIYFYRYNEQDVYKRNIDLILENKDYHLFKYIDENLEKYCQDIYTYIENGELSLKGLEYLIKSNKISLDLKKEILEKEQGKIEYDEKLKTDLLNVLLDMDKLYITFNQIASIYNKVESNNIIKFINLNYNNLDINVDLLNANPGFRNFILNNVEIYPFIDKLNNIKINLSEISKEENLIVLLENNLCVYTRYDLKKIINMPLVINKYFKIYENQIINDLKRNNLQLNYNEIIILFNNLENKNSNLFKYIIKMINLEILQKLLMNDEQTNKFLNSIKDYSLLANNCKYELLKRDINKSHKEKIICSIRDISNIKLKELVFETFNIETNTYNYENICFYEKLKESKIVTTRRGKVMYFKVDI